MTAPQHLDRPATGWRVVASATLHCLAGCAIGEILGMVLATWGVPGRQGERPGAVPCRYRR